VNYLIEYFAKKGLFCNLITIAIFIVGIISVLTIRKEAFPNIQFDAINITTRYPGASPEEVERLITNPLEQDLQEIEGIKELKSISVEEVSLIKLKLDPDQTNAEDAKSDVQEVVDRFTNLPDGAEDPIVESREGKLRPVIELVVAGDLSELNLRKEAKSLEKVVEGLPEVARVAFRGLRDFEIRVEADLQKMAHYQLSLEDLVQALRKQNFSIPGGVVEPNLNDKNSKELIVRTIGELKDENDVKNTVIRANDLAQPIYVKDVAKVTFGLEKVKEFNRTGGAPSISLTILKKEKADIIDLVDKVQILLKQSTSSLNPKIRISYVNDLSYFIRRRIKVLSSNLMIGLILVMTVLSIMLPGRLALITAIGIPFAFLSAITLFDIFNVSINLISLMGFIIVIGMLVDDAVVVTENAARFIDDGMKPTEAAIKATQQIWPAVTASVFTTIMAFLPFVFMTGIFGKFLIYIPIAVISALSFSLLECFFILPHHIGFWMKAKVSNDSKNNKKKVKDKVTDFWNSNVVPKYISALKVVIKNRYAFFVLALSFIMGTGYFAVNKMKFVLFPPGGVEVFIINIDAPEGTVLKQTSKLVVPIEEAIAKLPKIELDNFITKIGIQQSRPNDPNTKRGGEFAQIVVYLTPEQSRIRSAKEIVSELRGQLDLPTGLKRIAFERISGGPPVGKPINVGVSGRKYEEILPVVKMLKQKISKLAGVIDMTDDYVLGKEELRVIVNQAEASAADLNVFAIGNSVRAAYEGIVATKIRTLDEEISIRVSFPESSRQSAKTLLTITPDKAITPIIPINVNG